MRREELYLADLIDNARAVRGYLDGVTRERWDAEDILRDAVLYRMLLLSALAISAPPKTRARPRPRTWPGEDPRSATWRSTSTSGSTGRLSGRSPRKSRLSWRSRCWRLSARSIPHWPRATSRDPHRIRVRHPYAITVTRSISAGTGTLLPAIVLSAEALQHARRTLTHSGGKPLRLCPRVPTSSAVRRRPAWRARWGVTEIHDAKLELPRENSCGRPAGSGCAEALS